MAFNGDGTTTSLANVGVFLLDLRLICMDVGDVDDRASNCGLDTSSNIIFGVAI